MGRRREKPVKWVLGRELQRTDRAVLLDCHRGAWVPKCCIIAKRATHEADVFVYSITPFDARRKFEGWKNFKALKPGELQGLLKTEG